MSPASHSPVTWLERTLWAVALVCSGVFTASLFAHQAVQETSNHAHQASNTQPGDSPNRNARLDIPELQLKVPVLYGCSALNLERGACHMEGSADFGGLGNAAVAGHRDRDFRPLERLHKGMAILISQGDARYRYVVDSFEIVRPDDVQVLSIHERPELTLITCYPFHYLGSAPKRFVVHAHLDLAA